MESMDLQAMFAAPKQGVSDNSGKYRVLSQEQLELERKVAAEIARRLVEKRKKNGPKKAWGANVPSLDAKRRTISVRHSVSGPLRRSSTDEAAFSDGPQKPAEKRPKKVRPRTAQSRRSTRAASQTNNDAYVSALEEQIRKLQNEAVQLRSGGRSRKTSGGRYDASVEVRGGAVKFVLTPSQEQKNAIADAWASSRRAEEKPDDIAEAWASTQNTAAEEKDDDDWVAWKSGEGDESLPMMMGGGDESLPVLKSAKSPTVVRRVEEEDDLELFEQRIEEDKAWVSKLKSKVVGGKSEKPPKNAFFNAVKKVKTVSAVSERLFKKTGTTSRSLDEYIKAKQKEEEEFKRQRHFVANEVPQTTTERLFERMREDMDRKSMQRREQSKEKMMRKMMPFNGVQERTNRSMEIRQKKEEERLKKEKEVAMAKRFVAKDPPKGLFDVDWIAQQKRRDEEREERIKSRAEMQKNLAKLPKRMQEHADRVAQKKLEEERRKKAEKRKKGRIGGEATEQSGRRKVLTKDDLALMERVKPIEKPDFDKQFKRWTAKLRKAKQKCSVTEQLPFGFDSEERKKEMQQKREARQKKIIEEEQKKIGTQIKIRKRPATARAPPKEMKTTKAMEMRARIVQEKLAKRREEEERLKIEEKERQERRKKAMAEVKVKYAAWHEQLKDPRKYARKMKEQEREDGATESKTASKPSKKSEEDEYDDFDF